MFKIRKTLTDRQLIKCKVTSVLALMVISIQIITSVAVSQYTWNDTEFALEEVQTFSRGQIVTYTNKDEICSSWVLIPGQTLSTNWVLVVYYGLALTYLFLGISIVADLFMESIEQITSQKQVIIVPDAEGRKIEKKVHIWNKTMANLTLMALGSSAPEIFLAIIETLQDLGSVPGDMGPSTIVGSAAFNLLVISGVSVYAVSEENDVDEDRDDTVPVGVKKIYDMNVFSITAVCSVWAYVWMYLVLEDDLVTLTEAFITFGFMVLLCIAAYIADRITASQAAKLYKETGQIQDGSLTPFTYLDFYNTLLQTNDSQDKAQEGKAREMRAFLKQMFGTESIELIDKEELKKKIQGENPISRIKYRKEVGNLMAGRRQVVKKGEIFKSENVLASKIDDKLKNPDFGFKCLHYSVSEANKFILINIINKRNVKCEVAVRTIDGEAIDGEDYNGIDETISFEKGENEKGVKIGIIDDEGWEPDEDFYVELYNPNSNDKQRLSGEDTRTVITILDDDKPGIVSFASKNSIKVIATEEYANIKVVRQNGADGKVSVQFATEEIDGSQNTATPDVDFEHIQGTLHFDNKECEKTINVKILPRPTQEVREEAFRVRLFSPQIVKLSKKDTIIVEIVTDEDSKKKSDALQQLLNRINAEEERTFGKQFCDACMLHPTKDEDGKIEDVSGLDAFFHFCTIGWKVLFALIPPPHIWGGWASFIVAISMIGLITMVVGEFATIFGCVLGLKTQVTAITFVAIGTSLPDTFASMKAAKEEKYADSAVGNVTGSNSVNVFLGLGLPWVIAALWYNARGEQFVVPAGELAFSVMVFLIVSVTCLLTLIARRFIVGGELGGTSFGRTISAIFMVSLWLIYITLSTLKAYSIAPFNEE